MTNYKTILTFTYPHEAHLAKGYLASEGIETIIKDEVTAQVNNFISNAIGGVKLLIHESDYDQGVEILQKGGYIVKTEKQPKAKALEKVYIHSKSEINHCPYCHSDNLNKVKKPNLFSLIGLLFFQGFFPISGTSYHCYDCEKDWMFKIRNR